MRLELTHPLPRAFGFQDRCRYADSANLSNILAGGLGYDPSHLLSKSSICSNRFTPNCASSNQLVDLSGIRSTVWAICVFRQIFQFSHSRFIMDMTTNFTFVFTHFTSFCLVLRPGIEPGSDAYKATASPFMLTERYF